jgi:hypothetical protein
MSLPPHSSLFFLFFFSFWFLFSCSSSSPSLLLLCHYSPVRTFASLMAFSQ